VLHKNLPLLLHYYSSH